MNFSFIIHPFAITDQADCVHIVRLDVRCAGAQFARHNLPLVQRTDLTAHNETKSTVNLLRNVHNRTYCDTQRFSIVRHQNATFRAGHAKKFPIRSRCRVAQCQMPQLSTRSYATWRSAR